MTNYSRTTLRELKKRYLNILKKCLLANLLAFSFVLPSMAETVTNPATNEELLEALLDPTKRVEITNLEYKYKLAPVDRLTSSYTGEEVLDETGAFLHGGNLSNIGSLDLSAVKELTITSTIRTHQSDHAYSPGIFNDGNLIFNAVNFVDNKAISESKNSHSVALRNNANGDITFLGNVLFQNNQSISKAVASSAGINNQGTINFQNVSFIGNKAITQTNSFWGVGIYNHGSGKITINGKAVFKENYGESGGSYAGGTILYNVAKESLITFKGDAIFENNTGKAKDWGRSNFMNDGTIVFEKTALFKNNIFESGRSAFSAGISNGGNITFKSKAEFIGNKATAGITSLGGALTNTGVILFEKDVDFTNNEAKNGENSKGGAVRNDKGQITFSGVTNFIGNAAQDATVVNQGGAIWNSGTISFMTNSLNTFKNNSAIGTNASGGAIYNEGTLTFNGENIFENNKTNGKLNDIHNVGSILVKGSLTTNGGITGNGSITIDKEGVLDIKTGTVEVGEMTLKEGALLKIGINSLTEHGKVNGLVTGSETSKIALNLAINTKNGVYQVFDKDNNLTLQENKLFKIKDLENGAYEVSKKTTSELVSTFGGETEAKVATALMEGESSNDSFTKMQSEMLEALQSGDKAQVQKAKKALKAVGTSEQPASQSIAASHFNELTRVISQMAMEKEAEIVGHSGGEEDPRAKVYIKGLYDRTKSSMGEGFRARSKGAVLGVQSEVTDTLTLGVGYATSQTTAKEDLRRTEVDTNTGFVSAHYQPNAWWVSGLATFSRGEYEEEKQILSSMGKATYDVDSWGAQVMTGYDIKLENAIITPEVGLRYLSVKQEGYTDTLGTTVSGTQSDYLTALVGVKGTWDMGAIRPTAGVTVGYDIISDDVSALNTLANGASYTVNGKALDRLSTGVSLGVEADLGDRATLKLEYSGTYRKEYADHSGMLKLEVRF